MANRQEGDVPMEGSTLEVVPREELDKAYTTIATLTAMLDRELSLCV